MLFTQREWNKARRELREKMVELDRIVDKVDALFHNEIMRMVEKTHTKKERLLIDELPDPPDLLADAFLRTASQKRNIDCPYCGGELEVFDDSQYICDNCKILVTIKNKED